MPLSRRGLLASGLAAGLVGCGSAPAQHRAVHRVRYGRDPSQYADLRGPARGATARDLTVVLLHGGYWRAGYGAELMVPLADRFAARGCTTWNVEYRRVGEGGGYPATLEDVAAGVDALAGRDVPGTTVLVGHSAGGHLAVWAASRTAATPGGPPRLVPRAVVSLAGVLDLTGAAGQPTSAQPVVDLVGGTPQQVPERYRLADPLLLAPAACPVLAVRADDDGVVDPAQAPAYVRAATAAGGRASLVEVPGGHMGVIDPGSDSGSEVVRLVLGAADGATAVPR